MVNESKTVRLLGKVKAFIGLYGIELDVLKFQQPFSLPVGLF